MERITKKIIVPIDGSKNSLKSLDYLDAVYGPSHDLEIQIFHVLPGPPAIVLQDDTAFDPAEKAQLQEIEEKNRKAAETYLLEAKAAILAKGFRPERVHVRFEKKGVSVTSDICSFADAQQADALVLTRRGRTDISDFFMGETSTSLVEACKEYPVWIVGAAFPNEKFLISVDSSENALRAVDHAGFMLSGTDCRITLFHAFRQLKRYTGSDALETREELEAFWQTREGEEIAPYFKKGRETLLAAGIPEDRITLRIVDGGRSPDDDIMREAQSGGFRTVIMGRRGISRVKAFLLGSVTRGVLDHSARLTVWIVH
jgi:nucleotide-binding universal stress UspA family protein